MKRFRVECDIQGRAMIYVEAKTLEEAKERVKAGDWDEVTNEEWDADGVDYDSLEEIEEDVE